jgi:hypothetical protein
MTNPQSSDPTQGDLSQGTADRRNSSDKAGTSGRRGKNAEATKAGNAAPERGGGGPENRPGSDPKNPGDFGHH